MRVLGWAAAVASTAAWAQPVTESAFFEELPVVLSASRIPQSLATTPGAVTVIDREFIRATGYRDVPSLLKLVPGFHVATERGGLSHTVYHGLGNAYPNRMQVLVDGRSVYSPYFVGGVDWFAVPLTIDEIERIEVFRGSNSAVYGSNAALGVVNIVTRPAGDHAGTEIRANVGSPALLDTGLAHETRWNGVGLRLSAETRYDHGLSALVDSPRKGVVTLRGDYRLGLRDEVSLFIGLNDARRGVGVEGDPVNANGLRALRTENAFAHLRWRRALSATDEIQLGYYHNEDSVSEEVTAYLPPFFPTVPLDWNSRAERDNLNFQHLFSPTRNARVAWGIELRRDGIVSPRLFHDRAKQSQSLARAFASVEWHALPQLTVNAGAMLERYSGRRTRAAPRLFVNWQALPGHTLRAGRSIAYRAPSMLEEAADIRFYSNGQTGTLLRVSYLGLPAIKPERVAANEIGYLGQFQTWNGVLDVRIYEERIRDMVLDDIQTPPPAPAVDPRAFTFANSDIPIVQRGFEWHYSARPQASSRLQWSYSNLKVIAPTQKTREHQAPRHAGSVTWVKEWSARWQTTLSAIRYGTYEWGSGSYHVPAYLSYDGRIAYRFGARPNAAEIALVLRNQGKRHDEFVGQRQLETGNPVPRTVFVSVRLPL